MWNFSEEGPILLMSSAMAVVDRIRNFCNYMGTKLIVCKILTKTSSVVSRKIINQLNKTFEPLFRSFTTKLMPLRDNVHFKDQTYSGLSSEIEFVAISAPAPRMEKGNFNLLTNQS